VVAQPTPWSPVCFAPPPHDGFALFTVTLASAGTSATRDRYLNRTMVHGDEKAGGGPFGPPPGNFFRLGRCYHLPPSEQPALPPVLQVYGFTKLPAVFVIVNVLPDFDVPTTT
jgi:hypothetical protein